MKPTTEHTKFWFKPVLLFFALLALLFATWLIVEPATLLANFDCDGRSTFELATLPFYCAIVPFVWLMRPFAGSRARRIFFCTLVSLVAIFAVAKQLDLHQDFLRALYPQLITEDGSLASGQFFKPDGRPLTGTPFKMRVITNAMIPLGMKIFVVSYFALFFGSFAFGFLLLAKKWLIGVWKLSGCAWAWGCALASGVVVQISDRLPAWLDHGYGLSKSAADGVSRASSLCTCLEEGGEMMLAIFALLTIYYGWRARVASESSHA